jgi:hypothetical protein
MPPQKCGFVGVTGEINQEQFFVTRPSPAAEKKKNNSYISSGYGLYVGVRIPPSAPFFTL